MRSIKFAAILTVLLLALPAIAEEIVYFTNGQSLPVRSHSLVDGMVHVDLGNNARLAFPESAIDHIEAAGKHVALAPSYGSGSNKRIPTPEGSYPSKNYPRPQDRKPIPMPQAEASPVETDPKTGLAGYRPQGNHHAKNRRQMFVNGNMRVFGNNPNRRATEGTFSGTTQVGGRHVIGSLAPRRSQNARNPRASEAVPITMKPGVGSGSTGSNSRTNDSGRANPAPPASDQN